jgi:Flp pilus assembly pilin Flp
MRTAKLLGVVSLILVAVAANGCGNVGTQPNGAWTACGNVMRPSATSQIFGKVALAAQPSLDACLATALGIPAGAIHQRQS